ncbi:MAG: helix-turn-helix domain-containing protein [Nitrospira sp.]|nr:helix-turn-helix domain-containing protein [Nitrospira sp.]
MKVSQLLTVEDAANRLGLKVATIRRRILERKIDYVKNGRSVRIPVEAIERIITTGFRPAVSDQGERS